MTGFINRFMFSMVLALFVAASAKSSEDDIALLSPRVAYVTETSVYLDAGSSMGIGGGDRFEIVRADRAIAEVEVVYLSSRTAACSFLNFIEWPEPGDMASPLEAQKAQQPASKELRQSDDQPSRADNEADAVAPHFGFKGRIGIRYTAVDDRSGIGEDYTQPSVTLRLEGERIHGSSWGLSADVRARRTYRHLSDGREVSSSRNRVYRLEMSWSPEHSPWRFSALRDFEVWAGRESTDRRSSVEHKKLGGRVVWKEWSCRTAEA